MNLWNILDSISRHATSESQSEGLQPKVNPLNGLHSFQLPHMYVMEGGGLLSSCLSGAGLLQIDKLALWFPWNIIALVAFAMHGHLAC